MKYAIFENGEYAGYSTVPFECDNEFVTSKLLPDEKIDEFENNRQLLK